MYQNAVISLIKAIETFNPIYKVAFSTYAIKVMTNDLLQVYRKDERLSNIISLNTVIGIGKDGKEMVLKDVIASDEDFEKDLEYSATIKVIISALDILAPDKKSIIIDYFGLNGIKKLTQIEIGLKYGYEQSYVSRIISRECRKLRNYITKNADL